MSIDHTHEISAHSWVQSANHDASQFPIQNLPFGIFTHEKFGDAARVGIAIGDQILDVATATAAMDLSTLAKEAAHACNAPTLNPLMALSSEHTRALRRAVFDMLTAKDDGIEGDQADRLLVEQRQAYMHLPAEIGDYTDFFASIHHAANVGKIFKRPDPVRPNYYHIPVGYHGRASSVVVSGTPIYRPWGQVLDSAAAPILAPSNKMDMEVELAAFVRGGNKLGDQISINDADEKIFGFCLQNDWSARDIQTWENMPLGPFLSKSFATTISPWVVTSEALAPFRVALKPRERGAPKPMPHLTPKNGRFETYNIVVTAALRTPEHAEGRGEIMCTCHADDLYWTPAQMLTHHTSNGCNLRAGDMLGSGTMSGPTPDSRGCLLELTENGEVPLMFGGEIRGFLEDGDEVILDGRCEAAGRRWIGFGQARGRLMPAKARHT